MKQARTAGLAATLLLHAALLYGLWSYHLIPPPNEALTMFVSVINPVSKAKNAGPPVPQTPQPDPVKREIPRPVAPSAPLILASPRPVTLPSEPVVPPAPVVKVQPAPQPLSLPAVSRTENVSASVSEAQPVLLAGELSVSCAERTAPSYPKQSLRLAEQGKTVLLVELDERGRVVTVDVKTSSGFSRLDEAAVNAVKSWRCSPARRNGVAVRSVAVQPFNFALKGR
ncbi:MAG TPA: energy transducer TonB [Desulfuromonadales bacterium]|nr:energy transducer TonB [Desulfuromonadales bacterium]